MAPERLSVLNSAESPLLSGPGPSRLSSDIRPNPGEPVISPDRPEFGSI